MYEVIVGNVGVVHQSEDEAQSLLIYAHYVGYVTKEGSLAFREPVTLLKNGEIEKEYQP